MDQHKARGGQGQDDTIHIGVPRHLAGQAARALENEPGLRNELTPQIEMLRNAGTAGESAMRGGGTDR